MTSAPTKRTISPWMMIARLDADDRAGSIDGSRFRDAVPVSSAANKRAAERPTPTAVFRPSSATAMPMKPIVRRRICRRVDTELPAEDVERPGEAGEQPGDRHREEVVAGDADPAVARRLRVVAHRAHLVSERRAIERDRVDDERREREEDPDVQALEERDRPRRRVQLRLLGNVGRRGNRSRAVSAPPSAADRRRRTGTSRPR